MMKKVFMFIVVVLFGVLHTEAQQAPEKKGVLQSGKYGSLDKDFVDEVLGADIVSQEDRATFEKVSNISLDVYRAQMTEFVQKTLGEPSLRSAIANSFLVNYKDLSPGTSVYTYGVTNGKIDYNSGITRAPYLNYSKNGENYRRHEKTGIYWFSYDCLNNCKFQDLTYEKKKHNEGVTIINKPSTGNFVTMDQFNNLQNQVNGLDNKMAGLDNTISKLVDYTEKLADNQNKFSGLLTGISNKLDNLSASSGNPSLEELRAAEAAAKARSEAAYRQGLTDAQGGKGPGTDLAGGGDSKTETEKEARKRERKEIREAKHEVKLARIEEKLYGDDDDNEGKGKFWQKPGGQLLLMTGGTILGTTIYSAVNRATGGRGVIGVGGSQYTMGPAYAAYNQGGFVNPQGFINQGYQQPYQQVINNNDYYYYMLMNQQRRGGVPHFNVLNTATNIPYSNPGYYPVVATNGVNNSGVFADLNGFTSYNGGQVVQNGGGGVFGGGAGYYDANGVWHSL
jgi:hypothetical protein